MVCWNRDEPGFRLSTKELLSPQHSSLAVSSMKGLLLPSGLDRRFVTSAKIDPCVLPPPPLCCDWELRSLRERRRFFCSCYGVWTVRFTVGLTNESWGRFRGKPRESVGAQKDGEAIAAFSRLSACLTACLRLLEAVCLKWTGTRFCLLCLLLGVGLIINNSILD